MGAMTAAEIPPEVLAAREKLRARMGNTSGGGKGLSRRGQTNRPTNRVADEKQLQAQLKRIGLNTIPGIEEVNMFKDDGSVLHFAAPKVQAAVTANTYVITGNGENKSLQELLPGIINQLGPDNLANLKRIAESFAAQSANTPAADDDIPD